MILAYYYIQSEMKAMKGIPRAAVDGIDNKIHIWTEKFAQRKTEDQIRNENEETVSLVDLAIESSKTLMASDLSPTPVKDY